MENAARSIEKKNSFSGESGMRTYVLVVASLCLGGCATHIDYAAYKEGEGLPANGMKFALQSGIVTLTPAPAAPAADRGAASNPAGASETTPAATKAQAYPKAVVAHASAASGQSVDPSGDAGKASGVGADSCKDAKADGSDWYKCFSGVKPQVGFAAADDVWVAKPADPWPHFTTTKVSGQALGDSDISYKQVTVTYANNTSAIIQSAGADAAAGFSIAGPWGAVVGGIAGVVFTKGPGVAAPSLKNWVCPDADSKVDILGAPEFFKAPAPALSLPVVLDIGKAMAGNRALIQKSPELTNAIANCWRPIPNNFGLGTADLSGWFGRPPVDDQGKEWPLKGDGWFFRVIPAGTPTPAPLPVPLGSTLAKSYFDAEGTKDSFPFAACQKVDVQVTWIGELVAAMIAHEKAVSKDAANIGIRYIAYKNLKVADPDFVDVAKLPNGGIVTFHSDCGANVVVNASAGFSTTVSAALTEAQALLKAQKDAAAKK